MVNRKKMIFAYIFLILMALFFVGPLLFTFISSFKGNSEIFDSPFSLPEIWKIENYIIAWKTANMSRYMINSLVIALLSVSGVLLVSSMVAFVLSRMNFRFNKYLSLFFLLGMMIPMHTIIVPVSYLIGAFNLKNNIFALVLLYIAFSIPFSTAILTNFMSSISKEIEEAAIVDGASYFTIYWKIILPMTVPALSTVGIFNFLSAWNDVLFPLLMINDNNLKTISLGLLSFNGERGSEYGLLMAAITITISIPFIVYIVFQEKVEKGVAGGAVKG